MRENNKTDSRDTEVQFTMSSKVPQGEFANMNIWYISEIAVVVQPSSTTKIINWQTISCYLVDSGVIPPLTQNHFSNDCLKGTSNSFNVYHLDIHSHTIIYLRWIKRH